MSEIIQAYVNAQNQTMEQVMSTDITTQAQEQDNPIEQAYVSASYAQRLEVDNKKLRDELAALKASVNANTPNPLTTQFLFAIDAYIEEKVTQAVANQEDKMREIAEEVADEKITEHTNEYDHYEMECAIERIDDKIEDAISEAVSDLDISDKINDALSGATVSISI